MICVFFGFYGVSERQKKASYTESEAKGLSYHLLLLVDKPEVSNTRQLPSTFKRERLTDSKTELIFFSFFFFSYILSLGSSDLSFFFKNK